MAYYVLSPDEEPNIDQIIDCIETRGYHDRVLAWALCVEPETVRQSDAEGIWCTLTPEDRERLALSWYEHDCERVLDFLDERRMIYHDSEW